eukprot:1519663-Rhodomonas_salina.2
MLPPRSYFDLAPTPALTCAYAAASSSVTVRASTVIESPLPVLHGRHQHSHPLSQPLAATNVLCPRALSKDAGATVLAAGSSGREKGCLAQRSCMQSGTTTLHPATRPQHRAPPRSQRQDRPRS